jgi:(heptosyl)LPS beta-1,4-glucosyltransferase
VYFVYFVVHFVVPGGGMKAEERRVSAAIITRDEAADLPRALKSVAWADDILVVDSGSADGTPEVARAHGARVLERTWTGFVDQKNFAADRAAHDWIFSLDADEACSPELAGEIARWRKSGSLERGFQIPRLSFFAGRWIRHTDWYPDRQLRLYDRRTGRWGERRVHESVVVDGPVGLLQHPLLHYPYKDLGEWIRKVEGYADLAARDLWEHGRRASAWQVAARPMAAFGKSYVLKRGFLDGGPGLLVAGMSAMSTFCRYARLYELGVRSKE